MFKQVNIFALVCCFGFLTLFGNIQQAFAYEKPAMSDFKMGMDESEVASILDSKYAMFLQNDSILKPRYIPKKGDPYGKLFPDSFFSSVDVDGITSKACHQKKGGGTGDITFIFVDGKLAQAHMTIRGVPEADLVKKLQEIYGGDVKDYSTGTFRNEYYVGKGDGMTVFKSIDGYGIVSYSADNADALLKAKVDAHIAKANADQQKKTDAAGSRL